MEQKDVQFIIDAGIGSGLDVCGVEHRVAGKFHERYVPERGSAADAYVLALDGECEIGAEYGAGGWNVWYSRLVGTYLPGSLKRVKSTLSGIKTGTIERISSEGENRLYPRYEFVPYDGSGFFLGIDDNGFDLWYSERIDLKNVSVGGF